MKPLTYLFYFILILTNSIAVCQTVNIPDANFKNYLLNNSNINTNSDGEIQISEANNFTGTINVTQLNISDLTGIEAFLALTVLDCSDNQLTNLDISDNTDLTFFNCCGNQLSNLDLSTNTNLSTLICCGNQFTSLNLSNNTSLTYLACNDNQLTNLDVSNNSALTNLNFGNNQLTSIDISNNLVLTDLGCTNNQLTALDISANILLARLSCLGNELTVLDASLNPALINFVCDSNQLASLDLSANTNLTAISCRSNLLTSLNVKNGDNVEFQLFWANNNPNLTCIEVDDADYSENNWMGSLFMFDNSSNFSEDCSISIKEKENNSIKTYPNPAADNIVLQTTIGGNITYAIYDMRGRMLQQSNFSGKKVISINSFANGVYVIQLATPEERVLKKFVKQ